MENPQFVAVTVENAEAASEVAREFGWVARPSDASRLAASDLVGRAVELRHAGAPFPVLLVEEEGEFAAAARFYGTRCPLLYVEMGLGDAFQLGSWLRTPVYARLFARLGTVARQAAAVTA